MTITQMVQEAGLKVRTRIEVEDVETAVELVGRGLADSVLPARPSIGARRPLRVAAATPILLDHDWAVCVEQNVWVHHRRR